VAHQLPLNSAVFGTEATVAAWHDKPTFYATSAKDQMIPPEAEAMFAKRMNAQTVTPQSSHLRLCPTCCKKNLSGPDRLLIASPPRKTGRIRSD
jgi:hypothetical protein